MFEFSKKAYLNLKSISFSASNKRKSSEPNSPNFNYSPTFSQLPNKFRIKTKKQIQNYKRIWEFWERDERITILAADLIVLEAKADLLEQKKTSKSRQERELWRGREREQEERWVMKGLTWVGHGGVTQFAVKKKERKYGS